MKVRPMADRVLIKRIGGEDTSKGGIIIPDTASKERPEQGTVIAVGPGKYDQGKLVPMSVAVGDRVMFSKYGFDEVKIEGQEYCIVSEASILAIIGSNE